MTAAHYMYMRSSWCSAQVAHCLQVCEWTITVPAKMIKFNLIMKAARKPVSACMVWRLLLGTIAMLAFGYAGRLCPGSMFGFILEWAVDSTPSKRPSCAKPAVWMASDPSIQRPSCEETSAGSWAPRPRSRAIAKAGADGHHQLMDIGVNATLLLHSCHQLMAVGGVATLLMHKRHAG